MNCIQNLSRINATATPATSGLGFVCNFAVYYGALWATAVYKRFGYGRT